MSSEDVVEVYVGEDSVNIQVKDLEKLKSNLYLVFEKSYPACIDIWYRQLTIGLFVDGCGAVNVLTKKALEEKIGESFNPSGGFRSIRK